MSIFYDQLREYYYACRHYCDEYKAYSPEKFYAFFRLMTRAFLMTHKVNLETGNYTIPGEFTPDDYQQMYEALRAAEQELVPLHDPEQDKIRLWDGSNLPWDGFTPEQWAAISQDGPTFYPHMVPFLQNDGAKHPAVLITGGSFRQHMVEGWPVAEFYYQLGYNAFVLNNRHGHGEKVRHTLNRALDLQRAIRILRARSDEYGVNPDKIFTNGFSMGNRATIDLINDLGVTTSPERIDKNYLPDSMDRLSARLNAYVSIYPATFPYDNHNNYRDFPPTFFALGNRDWSLWRMLPFMTDLAVNNVPVEMHLYDGADHGFGLADTAEACESWTPALGEWTHLLKLWLRRILGE